MKLLLAVALTSILGLTAVAAANADTTITMTPPAGSIADYRGVPIVDTAQPVFTIQATGGSLLQCIGDDQSVSWGPCGAPPPGCSAVLCATYTPAAPEASGGMYVPSVEVLDSDGDQLAQSGTSYEVDTTPPDTTARLADATKPGQPEFQLDSKDDSFETDTLSCSFTPVGTAAAWHSCPQGTKAGPIAVSHRDYVFQARAVDLFGRADPTPAAITYDPQPCTVTARRVSMAAFIRTGIPITVSCSGQSHVIVALYFLGKNGSYTSLSFRLFHRYPNIGVLRLSNRAAKWTIRRRLLLFSHYDRFFRGYQATRLGVIAESQQYADSRSGLAPGVATVDVHR